MLSTETGQINNNNVAGGYVRAAIRPMSASNKAAYTALVKNHFRQARRQGQWRRLRHHHGGSLPVGRGADAVPGNSKAKTDYNAEPVKRVATWTDGAGHRQQSPGRIRCLAMCRARRSSVTTHGLAGMALAALKNYVIYISNGPNQENSSADTTSNQMLAARGVQHQMPPHSSALGPTRVTNGRASCTRARSGCRHLHHRRRSALDRPGPGWTALLQSMSTVSSGKYTKVDLDHGAGSQIEDAIKKALVRDPGSK